MSELRQPSQGVQRRALLPSDQLVPPDGVSARYSHHPAGGLGARVTAKIVIVEIMIASGGIRHSQLQSPALQCCCLS